MGFMSASGGLTLGKLQLANATPENVIQGKTFYSGDKLIKTGLIPEYGYEPVVYKVGTYNPGDGDRVYFYLPNSDTDQQSLGGHVTRSVCAPIGLVRGCVYASESYEQYRATSFVTTKACRVLVVDANCNGFKGASNWVQGDGMVNITSADQCTEHSFGNWGKIVCSGYGINIPQGRTISIGGHFGSGDDPYINVRYFE